MLGWFAYWNWVLLLANLIPALPFDGGRVLRAVMAGTSGVATRDHPGAFWTARAFALILGLSGLFRLIKSWGADGWTLIAMAMIIEYMIYVEARMLEEGGYFDDGVFGYDFSEGYTSLEGGAAKVRPHGESALKRWRRRRSDLRRERRMAARPPRNAGWTRSSRSCIARAGPPSLMKRIDSWSESAPDSATEPSTRDPDHRRIPASSENGGRSRPAVRPDARALPATQSMRVRWSSTRAWGPG